MSATNDGWKNLPPYHRPQKFAVSPLQTNRTTTYRATCHCGRVQYSALGDPLDAKYCHCRGCQTLHGAPFEWVAIFDKRNITFEPSSLDFLYFYSAELDRGWDSESASDRVLPVKVSCSHCRTPIADEGRNMWLAFCTLFGFTVETDIPASFRHSCHLFYGQRCVDCNDDKPKWEGHRDKSGRYKE